MPGSWRIARLAGIDLSVHWTFGLLLAWVLLSSAVSYGLMQGVVELLFVLTLFGCVVLHELGHAMAARIFGVPTHGITLLPIGGVAQLDRMPRDPWQEWVIALAGPAVNVFIVGLLFPLTALVQGASGVASPLAFGGGLLARLMWVNVGLVAFNLLPAFPMDGGRLLRSWLASRMDYVTATRRAARLGQALAVLVALWGFSANPLLVLIAAFVVVAAESEYRTVLREFAVDGPRGRDSAADRALAYTFRRVGSSDIGGPAVAAQRADTSADVASLLPRHQILPTGLLVVRTFPVGVGHRRIPRLG
jgi:Zn-dependent protease